MTTAEKKNKKHDDANQSRTFIEKAREIGVDEDKSAADNLMGKLAKVPQSRVRRIKVHNV
jgi:hypothetical protein